MASFIRFVGVVVHISSCCVHLCQRSMRLNHEDYIRMRRTINNNIWIITAFSTEMSINSELHYAFEIRAKQLAAMAQCDGWSIVIAKWVINQWIRDEGMRIVAHFDKLMLILFCHIWFEYSSTFKQIVYLHDELCSKRWQQKRRRKYQENSHLQRAVRESIFWYSKS